MGYSRRDLPLDDMNDGKVLPVRGKVGPRVDDVLENLPGGPSGHRDPGEGSCTQPDLKRGGSPFRSTARSRGCLPSKSNFADSGLPTWVR